MARTNEWTPYYIRTGEGLTFHVETLNEAIEEFVGTDGYRMTLSSDRFEVVIRRDHLEPSEFGLGHNAKAHIVVRDRTDGQELETPRPLLREVSE